MRTASCKLFLAYPLALWFKYESSHCPENVAQAPLDFSQALIFPQSCLSHDSIRTLHAVVWPVAQLKHTDAWSGKGGDWAVRVSVSRTNLSRLSAPQRAAASQRARNPKRRISLLMYIADEGKPTKTWEVSFGVEMHTWFYFVGDQSQRCSVFSCACWYLVWTHEQACDN